ncbi:MAG: ABC transporter substrate-binding protein [Abditibacteriota bacterium]|nr:ABC transporter substrate-binding protein [Abditibacteriota bacterium]
MKKSLLFLLLAAAVLTAGCGKVKEAKVTEITVWHSWGGNQKELFDKVIAEYNRTHPGVHVRAVFSPNDTSNSQKFFTSVAAGKGPDVASVDGPQVAAWAHQGALTALDDRFAEEGLTEDDFFVPCWKENYYKGHIWAATYCADPNFAFVWNKKVFREAGLDPEKPPTTIEELDEYNEKITKIDPKTGEIKRIGILPWAISSTANSLYTWGWAFGGSFYDDATETVTADDPKLVEALEWMCSYAKKYDVKRINSFSSGFGSKEQNPFFIGLIGMHFFHICDLDEVRQYAPNLDFGVGYFPAPPDGEAQSSWIGGWCFAIPKGCKHPKEAWDLIKWLCADREGTAKAMKIQSLFPGYRKSAYFDSMPETGPIPAFYEILLRCKHQRPVEPAQEFYLNELSKAVEYSIYDVKTPKQALKDAREAAQKELDLRVAGNK